MAEPRRRRRWDRFFLAAFALFTLVALVHEPLFYGYCGWDGLRARQCGNAVVQAIWVGYAQLDPVYFDMPRWMALMIGFDSLLLAPFYVYSVWVFARGRADTPLYRTIATAVSGGLVYAMVLYLSWEVLEAPDTGADLPAVIGYNLPWGLVPLLLILRLHRGAVSGGSHS